MYNYKNMIPADGLAGLKNNFGSDLMSGFMVVWMQMNALVGYKKKSCISQDFFLYIQKKPEWIF